MKDRILLRTGLLAALSLTALCRCGSVAATSSFTSFGQDLALQLNGSASHAGNGSPIRLTDGNAGEAGSVFTKAQLDVRQFATGFAFQISGGTEPPADGFTFTLQGIDPTELGGTGGGLGYGPDPVSGGPAIYRSVAIKFDIYDNAGEGADSTGLYTNGAPPTVPAIDLTPYNVSLYGHFCYALLLYDGLTLTVVITDTNTGYFLRKDFAISIPAAVGGISAFVGFTGATGSRGAIQDIYWWDWA
jgi:hypothetical protein